MRKDGVLRKLLTLGLLCFAAVLMLAACGSDSKEDIVKKTSKKWADSKGYEVKANMEIKTTGDTKKYNVDVWHTKPEFYRVAVSEEGQETSQMIIRNEEGVFVVTPSMKKTYKFQSDWPKQNSQGYLINSLAKDLASDSQATMKETKDSYIFKAKTRNTHSKMLPTQQVYINKKTLLPTKVVVLNEASEEQIKITFKKITLGVAKKAGDYDLQDFTKPSDSDEANKDKANVDEKAAEDAAKDADGEATAEENKEGNTEGKTEGTDDKAAVNEEEAAGETSQEEAAEDNASNEESTADENGEKVATSADADASGEEATNTDFETHYPVVDWNLKLTDEKSMNTTAGTRKILSFEGDKSFTIIQEKTTRAEQLYIPVFSPGDPADLGFTVGAITDNSISWEADGVSYFIASNDLSKTELVEVASSMVNGEMK